MAKEIKCQVLQCDKRYFDYVIITRSGMNMLVLLCKRHYEEYMGAPNSSIAKKEDKNG